MASTMIKILAPTRNEFIEKVRRCGDYLNTSNAPMSPWSVMPGAEDPVSGGFRFWGEGQKWLINEISGDTGMYAAEIWVDDSMAATMIALLS